METETTDVTEPELSTAIFAASCKVIDLEVIGKQGTKDQKIVATAAAARAGIAQFFHYAQEIGLFKDSVTNHLGQYIAITIGDMISGATQDRLAEIEKERVESN
jgi:hypothetical protein